MSKIRTTKRKTTLLFTTAVALLAVFSLGVSTYAWFQANAEVSIQTEGDEAEITVAAPDDMVKFYYFNGNGVPGSADYTGYSASNATYGNKTNMVNTSTGEFTTNAGSDYTGISTFEDAWTPIELESTSTASGDASPKNCFNFSKMRVGCYYSFCIETKLSTTKVNISYKWNSPYGITGADLSPAHTRYAYYNDVTSNPLNMLMAINGFCTNLSSNNATTFIAESLGVGSTLSLSDKITFSPVETGTTTSNYNLLANGNAGVDTTTNKYVYFTIFMGNNNDAFVYNSTVSTTDYYEYNQTTGTYSPLDGLKSSVSAITVS